MAESKTGVSSRYSSGARPVNPMISSTKPPKGENAWGTALNLLGQTAANETPGQLTLQQAKDSVMGAQGAEARGYQISALGNLQNVMNQNGMTPEDRARLMQIQQSNAIREQGQRNAIAQQAAQRGVGGSGLALQQLMGNQQMSAQSNALQGTDVAAMAQARQRQAALDLAGQSGGLRGQDLQVGQAQDYINQFNTGIANQAAQWNQVGARQQAFQNQMDRATAQANVLQAKQGQGTQQRGQTMGLVGQLGSSVMGGR